LEGLGRTGALELSLDVEKLDAGYVASATPPTSRFAWTSPRPLHADELIHELRQRGVALRDIEDAVAIADSHFSSGSTARVRELRTIRRRFEAGQVNKDDVDSVIAEMEDDHSSVGRVFLVATLAAAKLPYGSIQTLLTLLRTTTNADILVAVMEAFANHAPGIFEEEAKLLFAEGGKSSAKHEALPWILSMASVLVAGGFAETLLDDFVQLARDGSRSEKERKDARAAIATVAGIDRLALPVDLSASALDELIAAARAAQLRSRQN
jgi:hypothetical protein